MTQTLTQPQASTAPDVSDVVVRCAGLTKVFKDFWMRDRVKAVDSINLEVRRGEVFGLLGPNGSGKSTTIKMILGLLNPTAGRIAVFGKPPSDVSIKQRIGYLPEESYLYRFLNARETLDYYGRLFHQNRRQRQQRIDMLLEMVGLDKVQRRPVGEYSKGMQRRIGIAQALINDPEFLILDEPTTGLDPIGTRQVKDLILDLARPRKDRPGKTVLLCSHLLADVEDVCDRVSIMFGGKVRREGTVDELLVQEGKTTLETESLPPEVIQEIEQVLERHGRHVDRVDHPRQKLEGLFLDIVQSAMAEGAATSGASAGGRTARFLTGDDAEAAPAQGEEVIESLVNPVPAEEPAEPSAPQRPVEPTAPAEPEASSVLDQLVSGGESPRPAAPPDEPRNPLAGAAKGTASEPPADESPDTEFLDALVNVDEPRDREADGKNEGKA